MRNAVAATLVAGCLWGGRPVLAADPPRAAQVDPYVSRPRILVLTDIANEPDDQMSLVRFLVYSNQWDVEGLVATTSTWIKNKVRPDVILTVLDAYQKVQPNLLKHAAGFPTAAALRKLVASGQAGYGMAAVGPGQSSAGSELIVRAALAADPRPLWVLAWGGTNTLAQALSDARARRPKDELEAIVAKLRVYTISDQDDAGPWLRREFGELHYIAMPSTQDGEEYAAATWTGISGDRFYRNAPGADFSSFTDEWMNANVRAKGPLGKHYPYPCCIHEGDTPAFLGLIDNGLASAMSPAYGGWGGRYVWRQPSGEPRAFWTQGGDSYPGRDNSRDTVTVEGRAYTSDQATIWRWRRAFQNDFAARMDWSMREPKDANHNPLVVVNGKPGSEPVVIDAEVGTPVTLDAAGTRDPDGNALSLDWFFYPEAGSGIPGQPVFAPRRRLATPPAQGAGGIPSAPAGGPPEAPARVVVDNARSWRAVVVPKLAGIAHVVLAVEDDGAPSLTSYRRVILNVKPASIERPGSESVGRGAGGRDIPAPAAASRVALTFDDLPVHSSLPPGLTRSDVARSLLEALRAHQAPPTYGFVNAKGLEGPPDNAEVLRLWRAAGHPLGNHAYSHMNLHANTPAAFEADVLANEKALRESMGDGDWRWFRYPYLREGETLEKRRAVARFLKDQGYQVAQVTLNFDDWAYNDPYTRCLAKNDSAGVEWLKQRYLSQAEASLETGRAGARLVYGRDIAHVMLLHIGGFQTVMLPKLLELLEQKSFRLVTLQEAQSDPIYAIDPDQALPTGVTLLDQMLVAKRIERSAAPDDTLARLTQLCR